MSEERPHSREPTRTARWHTAKALKRRRAPREYPEPCPHDRLGRAVWAPSAWRPSLAHRPSRLVDAALLTFPATMPSAPKLLGRLALHAIAAPRRGDAATQPDRSTHSRTKHLLFDTCLPDAPPPGPLYLLFSCPEPPPRSPLLPPSRLCDVAFFLGLPSLPSLLASLAARCHLPPQSSGAKAGHTGHMAREHGWQSVCTSERVSR